ncbi:MAG: hypothetical protein KC438_14705 [Thermomicrobiales bacterium]|nr:hypothetical protein [Thermomicrobiales bacterium]MCO5221162.1 hypothetical protein [Thermomicrobiales bacterium]
MTGQSTPQDSDPKESRSHERHRDKPGGGAHDPYGGQHQRGRNRRQGGGRKGVYRFEDQLEHAICQLVTHVSPKDFPVIGRPELATMPPVEVARTETRILLCDRLHTGPHLWPNGDETD